jgi:hypothetical protein
MLIYEKADSKEQIRQGDIFKSLPLVSVDPAAMRLIDEEAGQPRKPTEWNAENITEAVRVVASIQPVYGIVITQDCDAERDKYITFFLVDEYSEIVKNPTPPQSNPADPKWWGKSFLKRARVQNKWFYLPANDEFGFEKKMAVDFQIAFQVRREFLMGNLDQLRMGRLKEVAWEHFREKVANYFRRYAYNEWYPLTPEELQVYQQTNPDAEPFPWQK